MRTMGQRIAEQRQAHNLTQAELGDILGVKRQTICKWEKGKAKLIDRFKVDKMAEIFNCDPGWLMDMQHGQVTVTYASASKEPIKMKVSGKPIIGDTAMKIKYYDVVAKVKPEYYATAISLLKTLTK